MATSPFAQVRFIWQNGRFVPFDQAQVHLLSHVLHYGSGWFEGIRCYRTPDGPAIFRLHEHIERLISSCKIFRAEIPYSYHDLCQASLDIVRANAFDSCYIRPLVYRGLGTLGVNPLNSPIEVAIAAWPWGKYLGAEAEEQGVDVCVSSWRRPGPRVYPANAKAVGGYLNSQLIKMEAVMSGYAEGIALDELGNLSEGSGENLFLVYEGTLFTPPISASILPGVTRATVITLAEDLGIPVRKELLPRGLLYTCDEMFLTGTAAEVTPVRSVDRLPVGAGEPGPITRRLIAEFQALATGQKPDRHGWLTPVPTASLPFEPVGPPADPQAVLQ